jgi:hypothetical protein
VDCPRVASRVDGVPREVHDRRRRPHHHLIRPRRIPAFQEHLAGGAVATRTRLWGGGAERGEEAEARCLRGSRTGEEVRGDGEVAEGEWEAQQETEKETARASFSCRGGRRNRRLSMLSATCVLLKRSLQVCQCH